jgi:hypothetical protein
MQKTGPEKQRCSERKPFFLVGHDDFKQCHAATDAELSESCSKPKQGIGRPMAVSQGDGAYSIKSLIAWAT